MHNYKVCESTKSKIYPSYRYWGRGGSTRPRDKNSTIDRLLKQIERKVLRDTNISNELKDLKAAYNMNSPHFRDIYLNLMHGKVPLNKGSAGRMESSVRDYMTLDGLLFKIIPCGRDDYETVLCIPTSKAHILMDMYYSSYWGTHWNH